MDSLIAVWAKLDTRRRMIVIGATVAVFAAVLFLSRGATSRDMALLYAGLDGATAGEVITALDQRGVAYDVQGSSIFVPTAQRDTLRMTLAAEGLPANSAQGYELLDSLSGFGTTSQMFDAAYWRAKEGELARTMLASPYIRAARVHISAQSGQSFRREARPTAAVTVTTARGMLDPAQADALRYLVASSVPGMAPADVAVIDGVGGLMSNSETPGAGPSAEDRSTELKARVERLLDARVGPGNAVVEVSIDTVTDSESIIERRIDPDSRVAISTEVEESTNSSQDNRTGDVTVASNLPAGDGAGGEGSATHENSETRQITNFEISETQREIQRAPGAVRRITVAVLVNALETVDAEGTAQVTPRSAEELDDLQQLVASAVGFDAARGDQITIRSMAFEPLAAMGSDADALAATVSPPLDMMRLIQTAVLALVVLILGLFVLRPILTSRRAPLALADDSPPPALPSTRDIDAREITSAPADTPALALDAPETTPEDPAERLRALINERRDEAMQVLQSWMDQPQGEGASK